MLASPDSTYESCCKPTNVLVSGALLLRQWETHAEHLATAFFFLDGPNDVLIFRLCWLVLLDMDQSDKEQRMKKTSVP